MNKYCYSILKYDSGRYIGMLNTKGEFNRYEDSYRYFNNLKEAKEWVKRNSYVGMSYVYKIKRYIRYGSEEGVFVE